jgi:hypothetical protein
VLKLQSISKDWIIPTSLEQREIWKALVLAKYTVPLGHVSGQTRKSKDTFTSIGVTGKEI